jgi:hypothetical protein
VLSSRIEKVGSDRRKVRIYLDRLDPSDPANPKLLTPLNVPGILVDYDSQNDTLVTLDVRLGDMLNDRSCYQVLNSLDREDGCYEVSYALSLLGIDGDRALRSAEVSLEGQFVSVSASSSRVIYARVKGDQRYDYTNNEIAQTGADRSLPENQLLTFERSSTALRLSSTVETRGIFYSMYPAGENHTLFVSVQELPLLYLFNTAEFEQPSLQTRKLWGRYCSLAAVTDTYALCVSGGTGVQRIDF